MTGVWNIFKNSFSYNDINDYQELINTQLVLIMTT